MNPDNSNPSIDPSQDEALATPSEDFVGQENAVPETSAPLDAGIMTEEPPVAVPEPSDDQITAPEPVLTSEQPEVVSSDSDLDAPVPVESLASAPDQSSEAIAADFPTEEIAAEPTPAPDPVVTPPVKKDSKTLTIVLAVIAGLILIAGIVVILISVL